MAPKAQQDGRREISVKHEDIPGFMPAMTMAYFVKTPSNSRRTCAGDLIAARLIVDGGEAHLDRIEKVGRAELPPDAAPVRAMDVMNAGDEVPDDEMQDQQGRTVKLSNWRGRALAVTFVYTRCPVPDFCPLMDRQFAALQKEIWQMPACARGRTLSPSVSIPRTTPSTSSARTQRRAAPIRRIWSYVTGPPAVDRAFTSRFGVSTVEREGSRGDHHA